MKSGRLRRIFAAAIVVLMAAALLAGYIGNLPDEAGKETGDPNKLEPVTLKAMLFGKEKPKDLNLVLSEFEKRTQSTLNTKLDIEWNEAQDHITKTKLKMASGEDVDFLFDAKWTGNLIPQINQGAYQPLDKYFNNDKYPGLKKAFSPDFVQSNKINGHNYTIPLTEFLDDIEVIVIRKDLREKYGMPPIQSYDDLKRFYDKVLETEKDMIPLVLAGGFRGFWNILQPDEPMRYEQAITLEINGAGVKWYAALSPDGKKLLGLATLGDPDSELTVFPAPYNTPTKLFEQYYKYVEWNKYLESDVLSQREPGLLFNSGKAASGEGIISGIDRARKKLKESLPDADIEVFVYKTCKRNMQPKCIPTNYRANNSVVIPAVSKHIDRTMTFFDWLFRDQANHDLFQYGIEGKHWQAVGNQDFKLLPDSASYSFPGYELTWNPTMVRLNGDLDDYSKKLFKYSSKPDSYVYKKLSLFEFKNEYVKNEVAQIQPKWNEFIEIANVGVYPNLNEEAKKLNQELRGLGLDYIRSEVKKQLQAYLDNGGE